MSGSQKVIVITTQNNTSIFSIGSLVHYNIYVGTYK